MGPASATKGLEAVAGRFRGPAGSAKGKAGVTRDGPALGAVAGPNPSRAPPSSLGCLLSSIRARRGVECPIGPLCCSLISLGLGERCGLLGSGLYYRVTLHRGLGSGRTWGGGAEKGGGGGQQNQTPPSVCTFPRGRAVVTTQRTLRTCLLLSKESSPQKIMWRCKARSVTGCAERESGAAPGCIAGTYVQHCPCSSWAGQ